MDPVRSRDTRSPVPKVSYSERGMLVFGCVLVALGWMPADGRAEREPLQGVFIEAKDLTRTEMLQVRQLSEKAGKKPWLIYGFRYGLGPSSAPRRTQLEIYLQPDVEDGRLRRGRVLRVHLPAVVGSGRRVHSPIESTERYAHVVVLGRRPNEVNGKWDVHRPFLVDGEFDADTLFRIIALIRGSERPLVPTGALRATASSLAISRVRRTEIGVEVTLNRDDYHGEYINVEERNGRLVIVTRRHWIV